MQKPPVRFRHVSPQIIWCLRLAARTSDFRSDNAGSIPAGITTSCFDPAVKMPDCLSGYTGSIPVGRAKWYLHLAVRIPDSQSGHAGSNPAGITIWSIGVMVTYLLAMQKLPVQIRYVSPKNEVLVQRSAYLSSKQRMPVRVRYTPPEYPEQDIYRIQLVTLTS